MALRDFDRVRERRQIRIDGPAAASIASIVALAIGGAWWQGRQEGRRLGRLEALRDVQVPPMPTGPAFGVAPLAMAAPSAMLRASAPPVLPRRVEQELAPDLRDLAGGPSALPSGVADGAVAGAVEIARARSRNSVAEGEDLPLAMEDAAEAEQRAGQLVAAAPEQPTGAQFAAAPAPAAPVAVTAAPAAHWSEAALRSEAAVSPSTQGSFEAVDEVCVATAVHWPMTADGRPLLSDPAHVGGSSVEQDLRARTVAVIDANAYEAMGKSPEPEPEPAEADVVAVPDTAAPSAAVATPDASTRTSDRNAASRRHADDRTWYVQVKSLRSEAEAIAFAADMRSQGFSPSVHRADLAEQGLFFRIRLGPFPTAERAHALQARLLRATGHDGMVMSSRVD